MRCEEGQIVGWHVSAPAVVPRRPDAVTNPRPTGCGEQRPRVLRQARAKRPGWAEWPFTARTEMRLSFRVQEWLQAPASAQPTCSGRTRPIKAECSTNANQDVAVTVVGKPRFAARGNMPTIKRTAKVRCVVKGNLRTPTRARGPTDPDSSTAHKARLFSW